MIDRADMDNDGAIDLEDFIAIMSKKPWNPAQ